MEWTREGVVVTKKKKKKSKPTEDSDVILDMINDAGTDAVLLGKDKKKKGKQKTSAEDTQHDPTPSDSSLPNKNKKSTFGNMQTDSDARNTPTSTPTETEDLQQSINDGLPNDEVIHKKTKKKQRSTPQDKAIEVKLKKEKHSKQKSSQEVIKTDHTSDDDIKYTSDKDSIHIPHTDTDDKPIQETDNTVDSKSPELKTAEKETPTTCDLQQKNDSSESHETDREAHTKVRKKKKNISPSVNCTNDNVTEDGPVVTSHDSNREVSSVGDSPKVISNKVEDDHLVSSEMKKNETPASVSHSDDDKVESRAEDGFEEDVISVGNVDPPKTEENKTKTPIPDCSQEEVLLTKHINDVGSSKVKRKKKKVPSSSTSSTTKQSDRLTTKEDESDLKNDKSPNVKIKKSRADEGNREPNSTTDDSNKTKEKTPPPPPLVVDCQQSDKTNDKTPAIDEEDVCRESNLTDSPNIKTPPADQTEDDIPEVDCGGVTTIDEFKTKSTLVNQQNEEDDKTNATLDHNVDSLKVKKKNEKPPSDSSSEREGSEEESEERGTTENDNIITDPNIDVVDDNDDRMSAVTAPVENDLTNRLKREQDVDSKCIKSEIKSESSLKKGRVLGSEKFERSSDNPLQVSITIPAEEITSPTSPKSLKRHFSLSGDMSDMPEDVRQRAYVERYLHCAADTLEANLMKLDEDIQKVGIASALATLETTTLRVVSSYRDILERAVDSFCSSLTGIVSEEEASKLFECLLTTSKAILLPLATAWVLKLVEIFSADSASTDLTLLSDVIGQDTLNISGTGIEAVHDATESYLSNRWDVCFGEIIQLWKAFCTNDSNQITVSSIIKSFSGDCSTNMSAMTQIVLQRPRIVSPKDCYVPAAGASPLFCGIPTHWSRLKTSRKKSTREVAKARQYSKLRFVFTANRGGQSINDNSESGWEHRLEQHSRGRKRTDLSSETAFQLGALRLIGKDSDIISIKSIVSINGKSPDDLSAGNLITSDNKIWRDESPSGVAEIEISLESEALICGYIFLTSEDAPQADPTAWAFQGWHKNSWITLHDISRSSSLPLKRSCWTHPFVYNDNSIFISWFGEYLLTKDEVSSRITPTEKVCYDKSYIIVLLAASWMLAKERRDSPNVERLIQFYERYSKKKNFEIVLCSTDTTVDEFECSHSFMPWPAVIFSESHLRSELEDICEFGGTAKAILFDCTERIYEDLYPLPLCEDVFSHIKHDPKGTKFPWRKTSHPTDSSAEVDVAPGKSILKPDKLAGGSRKAKYIPMLATFFVILLAVFGVWPLFVSITSMGKGTCTQRNESKGCVHATDPGSSTCNIDMLTTWFLVEGLTSSILIGLLLRSVAKVWNSGLANWDLTLTKMWASGCLIVILTIFILLWFVIGNVLIWKADSDLCGPLATHGKLFLYTSYVLSAVFITIGIIFYCVSLANAPKTVRSNLEVELAQERVGLKEPTRVRRDHRRKRQLHRNPAIIPQHLKRGQTLPPTRIHK